VLIESYGSILLDRCVYRYNSLRYMLFFVGPVSVVDSEIYEGAVFGVNNSSLSSTNSSFFFTFIQVSAGIVSQSSTFVNITFSIENCQQMMFDSSELVNSNLSILGPSSAMISNSVFNNTPISMVSVTAVFYNTVLYPTQVSNI